MRNTLLGLFLCMVFAYSCMEQTKKGITKIKEAIKQTPLGRHCDMKNKIVCYDKKNGEGFDCEKVENPDCAEEERL